MALALLKGQRIDALGQQLTPLLGLAGGFDVPKGQDMIVSVYNIHRNPDVWEHPDEFLPERFSLDDPVPNEQNTDYR